MSDDASHGPGKGGVGCLIPTLAFGAILATMLVIGVVLVVNGSPILVWKTATTVNSGCPLDPATVKLSIGMPGADIQKLLGAPQSAETDGDLELWTYRRSTEEINERRVLGLLRIGHGSNSSSTSTSMTLVGGKLLSATLPGLAARLPRVMAWRIERLRSWSSERGYTLLENGRSAFKQLGEITPGKTVAADLERILGPFHRITFKGPLECRIHGYELAGGPSSITLHGPPLPEFTFHIFVKDGIVIHTPRDPCKDEDLLGEFDDAERWPAK